MEGSNDVTSNSVAPEKVSSADNQDLDNVTAEQQTEQMVSYQSHRRLLGEKKQMAARLAELEGQFKTQEQDRLAKEGQYKDAWLNAKKELETTQKELDLKTQSYAWDNLSNKIKSVAVSKGLKSEAVDDFIDILNKEDLTEIEMTDFNPSVDDIERLVENKKKAKGYMFKTRVSPIADLAPSGTVEKPKPKKLTLDEMEKELQRRNQQT